jgi:cytochrome c oxidase subunit 2
MVLAIVIVLLVIGSVAFHVLSPWWFTPIASNWKMMDDTVNLTFWVTGAVFVVINLFMAYAVIRYRHKKGRKAEYKPEDKKLEWWLTGVTTVGVAALLAPGLIVWGKFVTVPTNASVIEVVGQQWNWSYRYPGKDNTLGLADPNLISAENPFGIDPSDPHGRDDVLVSSGEMHIPINKPVKILLRSRDVSHQFAVPEFRVKMDMVPGTESYFWFTPIRVGSFGVLCEQLCGIAHFAMRGRVVVDEQAHYDAWLAAQSTSGSLNAIAAGDVTAGAAAFAVCSACHGAHAEGNQALNAPKLARQASWYLNQQLHNFQHDMRGVVATDIYGQQMRPMAATLVNDAAIRNVTAYIGSLPDSHPSETIHGDVARGKALYVTCEVCHGPTAEGIWATKAPRLAGVNDWYLARQLRNFRDGVRGSHPLDFQGAQMQQLSGSLKDDQSVSDLTAYLNTL